MSAPAKPKAPTHEEAICEEFANLELIHSDGEPMDSDWQRDAMNLLIESIRYRFADRTDFFVGGNMFIYYDLKQVRNRNFRGPDFFYVKGRPLHPQRLYWAIWDEEGRFPNVNIELISPSTEREDRTKKFTIYEENFRTPEYFLFDRWDSSLEGYRLSDAGKYRSLTPNERGWLWCEELGLWLGTWQGEFHRYNTTWLRFYEPDATLVLIGEEAEKQRAEHEKKRADDEKKRADDLAAELTRLRAQIGTTNGPT